MSRTLPRLAFAVLVGSLGFAAAAPAHTAEYTTAVNVEEGGVTSGSARAVGSVGSPDNGNCRPNRTVKLRVFRDQGKPVIIDKGRTSRNGFFYLYGILPDNAEAVDVVATKKNIGPAGHKHICAADAAPIAI